MNHTYPSIKVNDIETTIDWYVDFLKFQCTFKSSLKHPGYALLEKGDQKIYLIKDEARESYASNTLVFETPDLEKEFEMLDSAGVIFTKPIENGVFTESEFEIKDYEDNRLIYIKKI